MSDNSAFENPKLVQIIYGDVPAFMGQPYKPDLTGVRADAVVVGMPYDGIATLRGGATRLGPSAIRKISLLYGSYNLDWDFDVLQDFRVVDTGDIDVVPGDNAESYRRLEKRIALIHKTGAVPFMIGGDHGVTYPAVKAAAAQTKEKIGFLVFDTHLDLSESYREDRLTRASPLKRICEIENVDPRRVAVIGARGPRNVAEWTPIADELGIRIYGMEEIEQRGIREVTKEALARVSPNGEAPYVSVDIDALDPAYAPATNSIEPGGLTAREIIAGVRLACENGVIGFDLVEVAPEHDTPSQSTSALAGRIFAEAFATLAARKANLGRAWESAPKRWANAVD